MWKYDYTTFGIHSHSHWHLWRIQIIKGLQLVSFSNQRFHLRGNTYLIWCEWCKVLQCWEDSEAQTECLSTRKPNLKTAHYSFNFYDFFCNFVHYQGMHGIHQFKTSDSTRSLVTIFSESLKYPMHKMGVHLFNQGKKFCILWYLWLCYMQLVLVHFCFLYTSFVCNWKDKNTKSESSTSAVTEQQFQLFDSFFESSQKRTNYSALFCEWLCKICLCFM